MNGLLLLVAHGTRDPAGLAEIGRIATAVGERFPASRIAVAYVDVTGPSIVEVLAEAAGPVIVIPLFLAAGYHVHHDVPSGVRDSGRQDVFVAPPLGPDPALTPVLRERAEQAGAGAADPVVLAAAGSSDERALREVETTAARVARDRGGPVQPAYLSAASPRVADVVAVNTVVVPYLLAPGFFLRRAAGSGARSTAGPLGAHPLVVEVIAQRYREALSRAAFPVRQRSCGGA